MRLSEIRELLATRDIQLTKSLGQNFLHDANQLQHIVDAAELTKNDKVLEIGPGLGPLTVLLLEKAGEVLAIEKDKRLVEVLRERFTCESEGRVPRAPNSGKETKQGLAELVPSKFELLHDDALEFIKREQRDWSDWKLVANLPFSVASPILVELAQSPKRPERMVVTLQLEVVQRLMAKADDEDYGILTLLIQLDYEPREWFQIPRSCFFPEPDVDSACVVLIRRAKPLLADEHRTTFVKIVKRAFSQRRKMMMKLLKADWPLEKLERIFAELKISPQERAEKLSLEQFVHLSENLCTPALLRWTMAEEIFDVVNERDEVIDRKPRSKVHLLGLKHRAVHVLVFNSRGEVFLQKRSMKKDRQPGLWDSSASGHVDSGEDYDSCAVRELKEEIGLVVGQSPKRLFKIDACDETDQEFVWVYRCESDGPFQLNPDEIDSGDWFATRKITQWMAERPQDFASALLFIWRKLYPQI